MRHDVLDRYSRLTSPIHRLPTALKLVVSLCLVASTVAVDFTHEWFFLLMALILVAVAAVTTIPWKFIL